MWKLTVAPTVLARRGCLCEEGELNLHYLDEYIFANQYLCNIKQTFDGARAGATEKVNYAACARNHDNEFLIQFVSKQCDVKTWAKYELLPFDRKKVRTNQIKYCMMS